MYVCMYVCMYSNTVCMYVPADFRQACDESVEIDVAGLLGVELAEEALAQQPVQGKVLQEGLFIHTLA